MRKIRVQVVSVLLLLILLLTGCSSEVKNYVHTDIGLKNEAENALQEKYDEAFVIKAVWTESQTTFHAICAPTKDESIVFEAEIYKDGRGVYDDEYIQALVADQIEDRMQNKVGNIFEDCYVVAHFYGSTPSLEELMESVDEPKSLEYFKNMTVEEYYALDSDVRLGIKIFVNNSNLKYDEETVLEEFKCFARLFEDEPMQNAGFSGYCVDEDTMNECKEYFLKESKARGTFDEIIIGAEEFGFGFNDGIINVTFEEYYAERKDGKTNE